MDPDDDYDNEEWEDATPASGTVVIGSAPAKQALTPNPKAPLNPNSTHNGKQSKNSNPQQQPPATTPGKAGGIKRKAGVLGTPAGGGTGGGGKTPIGKLKKGVAQGGSEERVNATGATLRGGGPDDEEGEEEGGVAGEEEGGGGRGGKGGGNAGKEEEEEEDGYKLLDVDLTRIPTMNVEKMQEVLERFTPEQMNRYEAFRRSGFQKSNMKRLVQTVAGCQVTPQMPIVVSGITKIFVGELVDAARGVMSERGETGPIRPGHIREAFSRLQHDGKVPRRSRPPLKLR